MSKFLEGLRYNEAQWLGLALQSIQIASIPNFYHDGDLYPTSIIRPTATMQNLAFSVVGRCLEWAPQEPLLFPGALSETFFTEPNTMLEHGLQVRIRLKSPLRDLGKFLHS